MYLLKVFRITLQLFALMAISFASGIALGNTKAVIDPFATADTISTMSIWTIVLSAGLWAVESGLRYRRNHRPITTPEQGAP